MRLQQEMLGCTAVLYDMLWNEALILAIAH